MSTRPRLAAARARPERKDQRQEAARLLVQIAPRVTQAMRARIRRTDFGSITVPQMRALRFIRHIPHASLGELAEFLFISSPSASMLVNRLVRQGLVLVKVPAENRRRLRLTLTAKGDAAVAKAIELTQDDLADKLRVLSPTRLSSINKALDLLLRCFD
jgi:DNA-binding MarR family transcriptional regulator